MVASEDFSDEDFVTVSSCIVLVLAVALAGLSYTGIDIAVSEERHTQDVKPKINTMRSETAAKCFLPYLNDLQKLIYTNIELMAVCNIVFGCRFCVSNNSV